MLFQRCLSWDPWDVILPISRIFPSRKVAWNAPGSRTWSIRQTPNANSRRSDAEPMAPPFAKLAYLYVGTSDFKRDLEYYTKVLGAEVLWNYNEFDANVAGLRLAEGPQFLLADHRPAPSCLPLFEVKDLKATAKELRARGWKSDGRPVEIPPGPCYVFEDPSGNPIGIFENARPGLVAQAFGGASRGRRS